MAAAGEAGRSSALLL